MQTQKLSGALFYKMMKSGAANLKNNIKTVNDLNVFPIPDGDTGDNMSMTASGGVSYVKNTNSLCGVCAALSRGMLLAARGNSGVILSQFFEGLNIGFKDKEEADVSELCDGFLAGVAKAYKSVFKPTEGTMLTVMREAAEYAKQNSCSMSGIEDYFIAFKEEMLRSLKRTPELLNVLKEAGVVDSGGAGFYYITEGMISALSGKEVKQTESFEQEKKAPAILDSAFDENSVMEFGYCTEALLQLQNSKVDISSFDERLITDALTEMGGESIVCVKTGSIVKIHVHTMTPGNVFNMLQRYGEFISVKVENMMIQHNETEISDAFSAPEEKKPLAVVTVASGEGIKQMFYELGASYIVDGNQTMNPSSEDFLKAFCAVNAENIIVLPNNDNITMAARQAAEMFSGANIRIVETSSVAEGYSALTMLDPASNDLEIIAQGLEEAVSNVITGLVTYAVRDCVADGTNVKKGDWLGMIGKHIICDAKDKLSCAKELLKKADFGKREIILCMAGADVTEEQRMSLCEFAQNELPSMEFYIMDGGQEVYSFIFAVE